MNPKEAQEIENRVLSMIQRAVSQEYMNDRRTQLLEAALELQKTLPAGSVAQMSVMYERRLKINPRKHDLVEAIRACPAIDENGYLCEKSEAIKAIDSVVGDYY